MIDWTFELDDLTIDQPIGFADVVIRAKRDDNWHGIFFEASTSDLVFYGEAAEYLVSKKEGLGFAADVTFRAVATCGLENDILTGKLDFRKYKKSCGNECLVSMPVEMEGCAMTLRNRYDQKVDLSDNKAFDKFTVLPTYGGLNFPMDLTAQELKAGTEGYVVDAGDIVDLTIFADYTGDPAVRPTYGRAIDESLQTSQLLPTVFAASDNGLNDEILSPVLLLDEIVGCFDGNFQYTARLKGSFDFNYVNSDGSPNPGTTFFFFKAVLGTGEWNEFPPPDSQLGDWDKGLTIIDSADVNPTVVGDHWSGVFDFTFSGTTTLEQGKGVYSYLVWESIGGLTDIKMTGNITFDKETYININANRSCPTTEAVVSLIHETASRITEAITDRCLTVKSDYYGRTDSEPYAATEDGCGSLRVLSSGLRIRKAENPVHFMSLKDMFDGLNGIDNIGMGIEGDELRIEPVEYFYQDSEIMTMPLVPKAQYITEDSEAYSIVKIGYKKWETEGINGLDEFNSNKEFRTSLKSISNPIDLTSPFVAGGYPIELTREQSFAVSGGADTKYDNENFIICVTRLAYGYRVEQGNIVSAANFYSPATAYNWRIRPFYNLMRWWKSLSQSYVNLANTTSKLFFSAGTGNLEAEGELAPYDPCRLEANVKAENDDLARVDFSGDSLPIWKPDNLQLNYPMSLKDFNLIKANPHGYISVQCGTGNYVKAFIINLLYKPVKGEADITLRLKWDTQ